MAKTPVTEPTEAPDLVDIDPPATVVEVRAVLPVLGIEPGSTGMVDPADLEVAALIANGTLITV